MGNGRHPRSAGYAFRFPGLRTFTVVVFGVLVGLALNVGSVRQLIGNYRLRNIHRDSVESLKEQVKTLEAQKQSLELGMFENEKSVREGYRLVRPGEKLILIKKDERTSGAAAGLTPAESR